MKNTLNKIIHKLWDNLPERNYKERIRIFHRNYFHKGKAKFRLKENIFTVEMGSIYFRTSDHPFNATEEHYQEKYQLKAGDVCIDAGAHNGHLSLFFSRKAGNTGRVIAIEPDEKNFILMQKNLSLNPSIQNITAIRGLLWSTDEEVEFSEQGGVGSSAFYKPVGSLVTVKRAITLDSLINNLNLPKVNLIKMDIEGAEINALLGAKECIRKYKPNFAIASYHVVNQQPTRFFVENFLASYNYVVETLFYGSECITYGSK